MPTTAAIATALVEAGYFVAGTATSEAGASAISERLGDAGGGLALNVTDAEQCAGVVKRVTDAHGAPAVLVNNAGITRDNLLMRMKDADVAEVLDANLVGAIRMSRLVMRGMMKARFGRIINIGSVVGSSRATTKLVDAPVVESVPARADVLYSGHSYMASSRTCPTVGSKWMAGSGSIICLGRGGCNTRRVRLYRAPAR